MIGAEVTYCSPAKRACQVEGYSLANRLVQGNGFFNRIDNLPPLVASVAHSTSPPLSGFLKIQSLNSRFPWFLVNTLATGPAGIMEKWKCLKTSIRASTSPKSFSSSRNLSRPVWDGEELVFCWVSQTFPST